MLLWLFNAGDFCAGWSLLKMQTLVCLFFHLFLFVCLFVEDAVRRVIPCPAQTCSGTRRRGSNRNEKLRKKKKKNIRNPNVKGRGAREWLLEEKPRVFPFTSVSAPRCSLIRCNFTAERNRYFEISSNRTNIWLCRAVRKNKSIFNNHRCYFFPLCLHWKYKIKTSHHKNPATICVKSWRQLTWKKVMFIWSTRGQYNKYDDGFIVLSYLYF